MVSRPRGYTTGRPLRPIHARRARMQHLRPSDYHMRRACQTTCLPIRTRHLPVWGVSTRPQDQTKRGAAHPHVPPHPGRHFKEGRETPHQLLPGDASPRPQHASRASGHVRSRSDSTQAVRNHWHPSAAVPYAVACPHDCRVHPACPKACPHVWARPLDCWTLAGQHPGHPTPHAYHTSGCRRAHPLLRCSPLPGHHCAANCSAGVRRASCWVWARGVARRHMCARRRSGGWPRIGCGSSGGAVRCVRGEGWLMLHWMGMKMTLPVWHRSSGACCMGLFTGRS